MTDVCFTRLKKTGATSKPVRVYYTGEEFSKHVDFKVWSANKAEAWRGTKEQAAALWQKFPRVLHGSKMRLA